MPLQANRLVLDATIAERGDLRFTPAGLPAMDFTLRHISRQMEAGTERSIECQIACVAFGDVARGLAGVPVGSALRCKGFLARKWRTGITLALHVHEFELLTHNT
ncbi:MAG: primosomal replication protein N [Pseudomonadota bacterium]|nr:primosomal replication protein N [Pseudomonadota bacterium]